VDVLAGEVNLYSHDCPGRLHVGRMKVLARDGRGLSTYISRHVGNRFAARLERGELRNFSRANERATDSDPNQSSTRQNTAFR